MKQHSKLTDVPHGQISGFPCVLVVYFQDLTNHLSIKVFLAGLVIQAEIEKNLYI